MSNKELCLAYLRHYQRKDLVELAAMLDDDVTLRDWKIMVRGKPAVVSETARNFAAADTIEIHTLHLYENENSVAAELRILVDGTNELHVVDVITFNSNGKIQAIRAYLGRADE